MLCSISLSLCSVVTNEGSQVSQKFHVAQIIRINFELKIAWLVPFLTQTAPYLPVSIGLVSKKSIFLLFFDGLDQLKVGPGWEETVNFDTVFEYVFQNWIKGLFFLYHAFTSLLFNTWGNLLLWIAFILQEDRIWRLQQLNQIYLDLEWILVKEVIQITSHRQKFKIRVRIKQHR